MLLGPHMVELFNKLRSATLFPRHSLKAHITVFPKEGKDPTCCGSYRPISLLNCDLKLFTKIIALHIAQHLQPLINLDQVGFNPTREAHDNTLKVLNLIHTARKTQTPCVIIGTDAEKAVDHVN